MQADSLQAAALLHDLHDVVAPAAIDMTPATLAWKLVAAAAALIVLWLSWRILRHRRLTRYRRQALAELRQLEARVGITAPRQIVSEAAALLKRAALSGYGRTRVASLAGPDWLDFLDHTSGRPSQDFREHGQLLVEYAPVSIDDAQAHELLQRVGAWIRGHDVRI